MRQHFPTGQSATGLSSPSHDSGLPLTPLLFSLCLKLEPVLLNLHGVSGGLPRADRLSRHMLQGRRDLRLKSLPPSLQSKPGSGGSRHGRSSS